MHSFLRASASRSVKLSRVHVQCALVVGQGFFVCLLALGINTYGSGVSLGEWLELIIQGFGFATMTSGVPICLTASTKTLQSSPAAVSHALPSLLRWTFGLVEPVTSQCALVLAP